MLIFLWNLQIDPKLGVILEKTPQDAPIELFIVLRDQLLLPENLKVSPKEKISILQNYHYSSQRNLVEFLKSSSDVYEIKQFWVVNAIYVKIRRSAFERLFLNRQDIDIIYHDWDNFKIVAHKSNDNNTYAATWNIARIKADSVWIVHGYTGNGVIIGNLDTGVDPNHPALSGKILTNYWRDAVNNQANPYDDNGHGTHTIGTSVGGDGLGPFVNDIGVAPNAKVVVCKAFNASGSGSNSAITTCVQHFTDVKVNSGVNIVAVNNSWGGGGGNTWLWNAIWNGWRANNIIPVFAAGNSGPGTGTVGSPGDYPIVIAVGATNSSDNIASFSSRGPAPSSSPYNNTNYWSRSDWNYFKPDIAAPGQGVPSSVPGGGYQSWDGTSMATPHVTGVIALMFEKNPTLTYSQVYLIITDYGRVRPSGCGNTWPNNNCGWGRIDALLTIQNTPSNTIPNVIVLSHALQDANANGFLDPGENVNLDITIKNNGGADAYNVVANLTTTNPSKINIIDNTINFGNLPSNTTKSGSAINDIFRFQVSPSAQIGDTATLRITINYTDAGNNSHQKVHNIPITVGQPPLSIVDIDTGTVLLSLPDNGSLGYPNTSQTPGNGFRYPKNASTSLYYASFGFGNSSSYLVDNFYNSSSNDNDIKREFGIYNSSLFGGPIYGHEEYVLTLSDGNFASPRNIKAHLIAYGRLNSPFVFLRYRLKNEGNSALNNVYMAIFSDFDLGNSYSNDNANTFVCNTGQVKGGAFMSSSDFNGYVGIVLVSGSWGSARVARHNPWPYNESFKWGMITGTSGQTSGTNADFSVSVSSGPYNLNVGDSAVAVFAFFGSPNQPDCNITDIAEKEYANLLFRFSYTDNKLKLVLPFSDELRISIYSSSGRLVFNSVYKLKEGTNEIPIKLSKGIYVISFKGNKINKTSKFVN
ncbi:MAG: S8 family peptidase [candidate division WOR-3 bacterium]|nr:S8 family peptidase [candidate division WOR-3 bacterium]